jgi:hypothetical protein
MSEASSKQMQERLIVPSDELRFGWRKALANLRPWLWLCAIGAFLAIVQNALSRPGNYYGGTYHYYGGPSHSLLALCIQALQVAVVLALFRVALRVADDKPAGELNVKELLAGYLPFLLTHVLVALIVGAGLILLVVPGVIWAITYGFAPMLCAAENDHPIAALRESRRLTKGHRGSLFVFGLLCLGTNILGALALGIGLFVTIPTTVIASAHVLRRLQAHTPRSAAGEERTGTPLVHRPQESTP